MMMMMMLFTTGKSLPGIKLISRPELIFAATTSSKSSLLLPPINSTKSSSNNNNNDYEDDHSVATIVDYYLIIKLGLVRLPPLPTCSWKVAMRIVHHDHHPSPCPIPNTVRRVLFDVRPPFLRSLHFHHDHPIHVGAAGRALLLAGCVLYFHVVVLVAVATQPAIVSLTHSVDVG